MSLKELKKFTDEQLNNEVRRREKQRRGPVLGYRAIYYGDDYNYGSYSDYIIGKGSQWTKKYCFEKAQLALDNNSKCGHVEEIYKDTPKPGKIH